MTNQIQVFVRGMDGNLWLETGPFNNIAQTIATRIQIDSNVSNLFSKLVKIGFGAQLSKH